MSVASRPNWRKPYSLVPTGSRASGGSPQTALPAGVTLQAIDGETMTSPTTMSHNYFSRNRFTYAANASFTIGTGTWFAGLTWDDPRFFSIQIFFGLFDTDIATLLGLNANCSTEVTGGSNMASILSAGIWNMQDGPTMPNAPNASTMGFHIDEPSTIADVTSVVSGTANAIQDGRIWDLTSTHNSFQFGDIGGKAMNDWLFATNWMTTPNATTRSIDGFSIDVYWFAGADIPAIQGAGATVINPAATVDLTHDEMCHGSHYGNMVDVMRSWANGTNSGTTTDTLGTSYASARIPIFALPENGDGNFTEITRRVIDPWEMNWAVWSSIIHGARGIDYFFQSHGIVSVNATQMQATGALIIQLAPVLNSPFAKGFCTTVSPHGYKFPVYEANWFNGGIELCVHWYHDGNVTNAGLALVNGFYIFATTRNSETVTNTSATFSVQSGTTANVVGESRSIAIVGGQFTDTFANAWTVHIYQIS